MRNYFDLNGGEGHIIKEEHMVKGKVAVGTRQNYIKIKKLYEDAILPHKGSDAAAAYDVHAYLPDQTEVEIKPHETVKIGTGIALELPSLTFGAIFARSGLASKNGLRPANCVGVVDADYRGEVIVALHNDTEVEQIIMPKERIAQLVVLPFYPIDFNIVDDLNSTERGENGFGSTGK